jgi:Concanavalin A-like lectin/glucanases superfamily
MQQELDGSTISSTLSTMSQARRRLLLGSLLWIGGCSFLSWDNLASQSGTGGGLPDATSSRDAASTDSAPTDAETDGPLESDVREETSDAGDGAARDAIADTQPTDARSDADAQPLDAAARYAGEILLDDPLLYFRFDEPLGATSLMNSAPGGTNKGAIEAGYAVVNGGIYGRAFGLTDASKGESARFALNLPVTGKQGFTLEGWFNLPAIPKGTGEPLFFLGTRIVTSYGNYAEGPSLSTIREAPSGSFAGTGLQPPVNPADVHLAIVYNGTQLVQYFDGLEAGRAESPAPWDTTALAPLVFSFFLNGTSVDELAVYNKALTPARIAAHATAGTMR